jgi:hypothetical protein
MDAQRLQNQLPQVRAWIDQTLAAHRSRTRPVTSYGFTRLPQWYSTELLSSSRVVEVPHVPVPPLADLGLPEFAEFQHGDYDGITYLNTYFVQEGRAQDESLHFHELVHVGQWRHLGPDRFLLAYAAGYLVAGSYRDNPLETMAYELQGQFKTGKAVDVEASARRQVDCLVPELLHQVFGV